MQTSIKRISTDFINEIWNENRYHLLDKFLHPEFTDHSLPPDLPANKEGLQLWVNATGKSFEHKTFIEDIIRENNKIVLKISMRMKHIGTWRGIEPSGKEVITTGYRYFLFSDDKVLKHWALIDGNALESQLLDENHRCKIQN
jgi:SnoaL-like polyketide cyclase